MKVYFPIRYIDVPASPPHEGDPAYRVSFGLEHWRDAPAQYVYKIQMVYGGSVHGRKSPSFPENTEDWKHVQDAMKRIRKGDGLSGRGQISPVGKKRGVPLHKIP